MIDVDRLKPEFVKNLAPGEFLTGPSGQFFAGRLSNFVVVVNLTGDEPFAVSDAADLGDRRRGLIVHGARIAVDEKSAKLVTGNSDATVGSVVITAKGPLIIAGGDSHPLEVDPQQGEDRNYVSSGDFAFLKWQVVSGVGYTLQVHCEVDVSRLD